jgi:hypothetical protein
MAATAIADPLPPLTAGTGAPRGTEYGTRAAASPVPPRPGSGGGNGRRPLLVVGGAVALVVAAAAVAWAVTRGDPGDGGPQNLGNGSPSPGLETTEPTGGTDPEPPPPPPPPVDEQCTDAIQANPRWVCVTSAVWDGSQLVIEYDEQWGGAAPDINGGFHVHVYGGDGTTPPAEVMGNHVPEDSRGDWLISDDNPVILDSDQFVTYVGEEEKVCLRVANGAHELVQDNNGGYETGNCWPVQR